MWSVAAAGASRLTGALSSRELDAAVRVPSSTPARCSTSPRRSRRSTPRCAACRASGRSLADRRRRPASSSRAGALAASGSSASRPISTCGAASVARRRDLEAINAALVRCKDAVWAVRARPAPHRPRRRRPRRRRARRRRRSRRSRRCRSRCRRSTGSRSAAATRPGCTSSSAVTASTSTDPSGRRAGRSGRDDPLFGSRSVRVADGDALAFVYKAAAEIGELGDNTAPLRAAIRADELLRTSRLGPTPPRPSCSATPAGRASGSSPRRTPTR